MTSDKRQRLLVLRLSALGDVAMTIPIVYSVARRYPECRITMVTRPFFANLLVNAPDNVHVLPVDTKAYKGVKGLHRFMRLLAAQRPTAIADLHNVSRTWVVDSYFRLHGIRVAMVDKMRRSRRELISHGTQQPSFFNRYCRVFERLGFPVTPDFTSIFGNTLPSPPITLRKPAAGIAPFARYTNKTYPPELMHEVVRQLAEAGVTPYLMGARGKEAETLQRWAQEIPGAVCVAGTLKLNDELALIANLDVMVSMDSANQHLASLTGIPVVTIWGSTTPACGFQAYHQSDDRQLCLGLQCQPCTVAGSDRCRLGTLACMRGITPSMVTEKVLHTIKNR
ncbi:MAG: glycosyltransferase family 9 protein [Paramuribaculum sp.]|nr:glycosyltransferase family 9 protein [Paramuribaculum sp.]